MACRQKPLFDAGPSDQLFYDGSLQLPPELMLVVVDYLRLHDTLSLSLTCKAFYILFFPKYRRLDASTAECFLSALERDQPSLHYCHICVKLHAWRNQYPGKGPLLLPRSSTSPDCLFGPGPRVQGFAYGRDKIGHIRRGLKLRFHDARLVMNAHLYGAAHGLPKDALDYASPLPHHSEWPPHASPRSIIETFFSWRFRIINNELYRRAEYTIRHQHGNEQQLHDWMKHCDRAICHHLHLQDPPCRTQSPQRISYRIPEMRPGGADSSNNYFVRRDEGHPHRSCHVCFTDYQVTVQEEKEDQPVQPPGSGCGYSDGDGAGDGMTITTSRRPCSSPSSSSSSSRSRGVVITITTYQNFGSVRSPWERKWAAMTNDAHVTRPRFYTHEAGAVERMWWKATAATGGGTSTADTAASDAVSMLRVDESRPFRALWIRPAVRVLVAPSVLGEPSMVLGPRGVAVLAEDEHGQRAWADEEV